MFHVWLVFRFLTSNRRFLNLPSFMSFLGMALGVACLTAAMGVVNGFESALKSAVTDVFGHVLVVRRTDQLQSLESLIARIEANAPEVQAATAFVNLEGVIASGGKLAGVAVQGIDPKTVESVLHIRNRLVNGRFDFERQIGNDIQNINSQGTSPKGNNLQSNNARGDNPSALPVALLGKSLAKRFALKTGDEFKVVLPQPSKGDSSGFSPKIGTFRVGGILDLGKAEFDERYVVTDLRSAQEFAGIGDSFTGVRLRLKDSQTASRVASHLSSELGTQYWTMDWYEVNKPLFEAIKLERPVIFFVVMIMVVAASFNISSNLFVSVLQKYADISMLRTMGFSGFDVVKVYVIQGLFFGVLGAAVGLIIGLLLCLGFVVLQKYFVLLPPDIYRIDHVGVEIHLIDLITIFLSSILVCLVSTLIPAQRGAKLDPLEGLRYE
jgi:lipoprotein-releasing system permease protein